MDNQGFNSTEEGNIDSQTRPVIGRENKDKENETPNKLFRGQRQEGWRTWNYSETGQISVSGMRRWDTKGDTMKTYNGARVWNINDGTAKTSIIEDNSARVWNINGRTAKTSRTGSNDCRIWRTNGDTMKNEGTEGNDSWVWNTNGNSARTPSTEGSDSTVWNTNGHTAQISQTCVTRSTFQSDEDNSLDYWGVKAENLRNTKIGAHNPASWSNDYGTTLQNVGIDGHKSWCNDTSNRKNCDYDVTRAKLCNADIADVKPLSNKITSKTIQQDEDTFDSLTSLPGNSKVKAYAKLWDSGIPYTRHWDQDASVTELHEDNVRDTSRQKIDPFARMKCTGYDKCIVKQNEDNNRDSEKNSDKMSFVSKAGLDKENNTSNRSDNVSFAQKVTNSTRTKWYRKYEGSYSPLKAELGIYDRRNILNNYVLEGAKSGLKNTTEHIRKALTIPVGYTSLTNSTSARTKSKSTSSAVSKPTMNLRSNSAKSSARPTSHLTHGIRRFNSQEVRKVLMKKTPRSILKRSRTPTAKYSRILDGRSDTKNARHKSSLVSNKPENLKAKKTVTFSENNESVLELNRSELNPNLTQVENSQTKSSLKISEKQFESRESQMSCKSCFSKSDKSCEERCCDCGKKPSPCLQCSYCMKRNKIETSNSDRIVPQKVTSKINDKVETRNGEVNVSASNLKSDEIYANAVNLQKEKTVLRDLKGLIHSIANEENISLPPEIAANKINETIQEKSINASSKTAIEIGKLRGKFLQSTLTDEGSLKKQPHSEVDIRRGVLGIAGEVPKTNLATGSQSNSFQRSYSDRSLYQNNCRFSSLKSLPSESMADKIQLYERNTMPKNSTSPQSKKVLTQGFTLTLDTRTHSLRSPFSVTRNTKTLVTKFPVQRHHQVYVESVVHEDAPVVNVPESKSLGTYPKPCLEMSAFPYKNNINNERDRANQKINEISRFLATSEGRTAAYRSLLHRALESDRQLDPADSIFMHRGQGEEKFNHHPNNFSSLPVQNEEIKPHPLSRSSSYSALKSHAGYSRDGKSGILHRIPSDPYFRRILSPPKHGVGCR